MCEEIHSSPPQTASPRDDTSKIVGRPLSSSFRLHLQCALHEIGTQRGCRRENYLQQRGYGALVGLHSNWIGHFILASARPSDRLLEEHHLLYQLHSQHIGAVINLQVPGEHGSCGHGVISESGFSYTPQRLMERQIFYFNFPMEDSEHFELDYMLDICHTVDSQIATGEKEVTKQMMGRSMNMLLVGPGHGRTGVVVGCYFLYSGAYEDPMEAIHAIQADREGTFRNVRQILKIKNFNAYLHKLRLFFVPADQFKKRVGDTPGYPSIPEQMYRQKKILHGLERRALLYVPKIVDWTTRELIRRTEFNRQKREKLAAIFMHVFTTPRGNVDLSKAKEKINAADWSGVEETEVSVLLHLLLEWLMQLQEPIVADAIVTTALGRSDIESTIDELSKADKSSFATLQILACFMFQIVPVKPKLIRQLYSALAHILLTNSSLQSTKWEDVIRGEPETEADRKGGKAPTAPKKLRLSKSDSVYYKYKPTLMEIEYGLMLEASARFWIKLGKAKYDAQETKGKSPSSSSSSPSTSSPGKAKQPIFSQPWFRDRASLQYEQYNPLADALQHQKDLETPDPNGASSSTSSKTSSFEESSPGKS